MALGESIKLLRKARNWQQKDLAAASGVEIGTISAMEVRDSKKSQYASALASALGVSVETLADTDLVRAMLATGQGSMSAGGGPVVASDVSPAPGLKAMRAIPVVGEAKGGPGGYLTELEYPVGHGEGVVDYPTSDPNAYALRVRGDSMHPRYRAGEFIVIEPNIEPQQGDDVVVSLASGEKLLKELNWTRDGEVQLLSVNNHVPPMTVPATEIKFMHLVAGRVRRSALQKPGQ